MTTKLPHISDEHHFAIVNVATRAAQMDHHVERTIAVALRQWPIAAEFLLKNLGTDRVVGLLKAALLDAVPAEAAKINTLTEAIGRLRTERNQILHRTWWKGFADGTAMSASLRQFREFQVSEMTAAQVQKTADEMQEIVRVLLAWQDYLHEQRSSPSS